VTVNYATADGTATAGLDYVAASGTLSFSPGTISRTINVTVLHDTVGGQVKPLDQPDWGGVNIGDAQGVGTSTTTTRSCRWQSATLALRKAILARSHFQRDAVDCEVTARRTGTATGGTTGLHSNVWNADHAKPLSSPARSRKQSSPRNNCHGPGRLLGQERSSRSISHYATVSYTTNGWRESGRTPCSC
jgi:hypothetical protein